MEIRKARRPGHGMSRAISSTIRDALPIEMLEPRRLFAASLDSNGLLTVTGTAGNDSINLSVSGPNLIVTLGADSQTFPTASVKAILADGGDGNDRIYSDITVTTKETLIGGNGNDFLRGGRGSDSLSGGTGNDSLDGGGRGDIIDGGSGSDYAYYSSRSLNLNLSLDGIANDGETGEGDLISTSVENIQGGKGNDAIIGDAHNNVLRGGNGDDTINGNRGSDTIDAGTGMNSILGGDGDDTFFTRNGSVDTVNGGAGSDTLTGDQSDILGAVEVTDLI